MNIPFADLPSRVQNRLLWNMDLDYDSYESSKAQTIHDIECGNIDSTNELIIKNYCKALSLDDLYVILRQEIAAAERERYAIEVAMKKNWPKVEPELIAAKQVAMDNMFEKAFDGNP